MRIWSFRRSFAGSEMERVSFDEWGNLGQALHEVLLEQVSPRQTGRGVPSEGSILAVCDPPRGSRNEAWPGGTPLKASSTCEF